MALTRFFFILLVVLNLLVFAAGQDWLGSTPRGGEPERLTKQINPERLRFVAETSPAPTASAPAPATTDATPSEAPTAAPTTTSDALPAATDTPPPAATATATEPVGTEAPAPREARSCVAWAGLGSDEADQLAARLSAAGLAARRSSTEAAGSWWVRIPPQGSREQAERRVRELKALGIKDYFVVQDSGPNQFAISLGVFKTEGAAQQQLAQLRGKGVQNAGISPRRSTVYRIETTATTAQLQPIVKAGGSRLDASREACVP